MLDDGLERGLGEDAHRILTQWSVQQHLRHRLDRWFDNGRSEAKVGIVDRHDLLRGHSRKLVLKLDTAPEADMAGTEYARHHAAAHDGKRFASRHLAGLVNDPLPVGGGRWITFQSIAGGIGEFEPLGALLSGFLGDGGVRCDAARFAEVCRRVVRGVLAGWAGRPRIEYLAVPAFLRLHLGSRLAPGMPLDTLVRSGGHAAFALLREESLTEGVELAAPLGRSHGDLHVENALVRVRPNVEPDDFRLIDLAKYEANAPLGRDPAHFLVHLAARSLARLGDGQAEALPHVLLDPADARGDRLPVWLRETIAGVCKAGDDWIGPSGFGADWRRDRALSLYAAALMVYVRRSTRAADRAWFLRFAETAALTFLDSAGIRGIPAASGRRALAAPAPDRAETGAGEFIVGRTAEITMLDGLLAEDGPLRVLNIYGPDGMGKTEVRRKLVRHARSLGVLTAAVDVAACGGAPEEILRAFQRSCLGAEHAAAAVTPALGQRPPEPSVRSLTAAFGETLRTTLDGGPAVLFLDAYDDVRHLDPWVRRCLLAALPARARLVILGREKLTSRSADWAAHADEIWMRALAGLTENETRSYLRHHGLADPATADRICRSSGGYPLLLALFRRLAENTGGWGAAARLEYPDDRDLLAAELAERVLRTEHDGAVADVLEKCAGLPRLDPEAAAALAGVGPDEGGALFERVRRHPFTEEHPPGVRLHPKIRILLGDRHRAIGPPGPSGHG